VLSPRELQIVIATRLRAYRRVALKLSQTNRALSQVITSCGIPHWDAECARSHEVNATTKRKGPHMTGLIKKIVVIGFAAASVLTVAAVTRSADAGAAASHWTVDAGSAR
jgi:hypothetical protein